MSSNRDNKNTYKMKSYTYVYFSSMNKNNSFDTHKNTEDFFMKKSKEYNNSKKVYNNDN